MFKALKFLHTILLQGLTISGLSNCSQSKWIISLHSSLLSHLWSATCTNWIHASEFLHVDCQKCCVSKYTRLFRYVGRDLGTVLVLGMHSLVARCVLYWVRSGCPSCTVSSWKKANSSAPYMLTKERGCSLKCLSTQRVPVLAVCTHAFSVIIAGLHKSCGWLLHNLKDGRSNLRNTLTISCLELVEWTTGLEFWTRILEWPKLL